MGEKLAYYLFVRPMSLLPLWILYRKSDFFYVLLITIFPYRRKVIDGNIERSFPELTKKQIKKLRLRFYRHFADLMVEGIKNIGISERQLQRRFSVKNPELMQQLFQDKKNVLLVSGHYNNWEWLVTSQNILFPHQAYGIGMPMTSKFWDSKVNARRQRCGMRVIHAKNYKEELSSNPDELKSVLVLSDQSPGDSRKSYWTTFLNQPTAVLFGTELMAHEMNYAVVFFKTRKIKRGFYEMELILIGTEASDFSWGEITERHTKMLEELIKERPEYWLWSHKRWKREVPSNLEALKSEQHEKFDRRFNY